MLCDGAGVGSTTRGLKTSSSSKKLTQSPLLILDATIPKLPLGITLFAEFCIE